uniref:Uncharacterized protein n=1 Tax=Acrobeloides nanus TaxID=290746 RepID=A0A914CVP9_9BILA
MTILYDFEDCRATWSYKSLLGPGQVLCGEYVRIFGKSPSNPISKPLGTIYDEEKEQWIVADSGNNALRLFGMSSDAGDVVTASQLKNPSALAIWNPGKEVAVLDETNIRIFDQRSGRFITIADVNNCRGLGVTDGGEFVTIQYNRNGSEIVFYSPEMPNQILCRSPYVVNKAASNLAPKPCFLDISHNKVCVTD